MSNKYIGQAVTRLDAHDKAMGRIKYTDDLCDKGALVIRVLHSTVANGIVKSIDTLIAFLKQAIESGNVPEGQLEEIGENAPTADEAGQAGDTIGGDDATVGEGSSFDPDQVIKLATYSDVVALLAGASR